MVSPRCAAHLETGVDIVRSHFQTTCGIVVTSVLFNITPDARWQLLLFTPPRSGTFFVSVALCTRLTLFLVTLLELFKSFGWSYFYAIVFPFNWHASRALSARPAPHADAPHLPLRSITIAL